MFENLGWNVPDALSHLLIMFVSCEVTQSVDFNIKDRKFTKNQHYIQNRSLFGKSSDEDSAILSL